MSSHSLTNFALNTNHVSTVVSEVEILSSFARDLCSTAQNFVHSSESSVQRSEQSVSVVSLELPSSTIRNPFNIGSTIESSISCSFWTKVQWECVFGLLVALTSKPPSENELAEVSYVCSQFSCHPTELQSSFHSSKLQPPEFLNLSSISNFQDLRDQFSTFCLCASLWHLGSHFWFLWIFHCFPYSYLCLSVRVHSWTYDLLCLPLPCDWLPLLLRALQSL